MGPGIYVKRDTLPLLVAGEEAFTLLRDNGVAGAQPRFFITQLSSDASYEFQAVIGPRPDPSAWVAGAAFSTVGAQQSIAVARNNGENAIFIRCTAGRIAVSLVSPVDARLQFRRWERNAS